MEKGKLCVLLVEMPVGTVTILEKEMAAHSSNLAWRIP